MNFKILKKAVTEAMYELLWHTHELLISSMEITKLDFEEVTRLFNRVTRLRITVDEAIVIMYGGTIKFPLSFYCQAYYTLRIYESNFDVLITN